MKNQAVLVLLFGLMVTSTLSHQMGGKWNKSWSHSHDSANLTCPKFTCSNGSKPHSYLHMMLNYFSP
jgi:hypothetical protein